MQEYRYPKSGYTLYAVKLLYGQRSPHVEQFTAYALPPHDDNRLKYSESEQARDPAVGPGINLCLRTLRFGDGRFVQSLMTEGTGINTALTYADSASVVVSDVMFSQKEYDYFDNHWDTQVQYKVDILAKLLRALDTNDVDMYPMFVVDFPEIAKYLLSTVDPTETKKALWP